MKAPLLLLAVLTLCLCFCGARSQTSGDAWQAINSTTTGGFTAPSTTTTGATEQSWYYLVTLARTTGLTFTEINRLVNEFIQTTGVQAFFQDYYESIPVACVVGVYSSEAAAQVEYIFNSPMESAAFRSNWSVVSVSRTIPDSCFLEPHPESVMYSPYVLQTLDSAYNLAVYSALMNYRYGLTVDFINQQTPSSYCSFSGNGSASAWGLADDACVRAVAFNTGSWSAASNCFSGYTSDAMWDTYTGQVRVRWQETVPVAIGGSITRNAEEITNVYVEFPNTMEVTANFEIAAEAPQVESAFVLTSQSVSGVTREASIQVRSFLDWPYRFVGGTVEPLNGDTHWATLSGPNAVSCSNTADSACSQQFSVTVGLNEGVCTLDNLYLLSLTVGCRPFGSGCAGEGTRVNATLYLSSSNVCGQTTQVPVTATLIPSNQPGVFSGNAVQYDWTVGAGETVYWRAQYASLSAAAPVQSATLREISVRIGTQNPVEVQLFNGTTTTQGLDTSLVVTGVSNQEVFYRHALPSGIFWDEVGAANGTTVQMKLVLGLTFGSSRRGVQEEGVGVVQWTVERHVVRDSGSAANKGLSASISISVGDENYGDDDDDEIASASCLLAPHVALTGQLF